MLDVLTSLIALITTTVNAFEIEHINDALIINLADISWTLESHNISIPARIPSQVHLDLLAAGLIDEPTYGDNELRQAWIATQSFTYRSAELSAISKSSDYSTHLIFDGIDTFANVSFCGELIAQVDNQFRQWEFDITQQLARCSSLPTIDVEFTPAPLVSFMLMEQAYEKAGNSCITCYGIRFQYPGRQFIRKQQSDFGWDWGPSFAPQGIWQPARILQVPKQQDQISTQHLYVDIYKQGQINNLKPDQKAPWVLNVSVDYLGTLTETPSLEIVLQNASGSIFESASLRDVDHESGRLTGFTVLSNQPDLWWPAGHGKPVLYNLTVNVISSSSAMLGTMQKIVGFRTIVLDQGPISPEQLAQGIAPGGNWHFEINGHEFYAKGSNLVPPDPFWPRVTKSDLEILFSSAVAANQNMIRIWSSNIYLPDFAYDLADQFGLLLWSELQFSDAFYPNDTSSLGGYIDEVSYQVRRLNHHPSLALWCGGNELELILLLVQAGAPSNYPSALANYESIFLDTLLHAVFDNTRSISYIASSINNGHVSFDYSSGKPIKPRYETSNNGSIYNVGDYYSYDTTAAFKLGSYPVSRFTNEFGFTSHSSLRTYEAFLPTEQLAFNSTLMVQRNRHYPLNVTYLFAQSPYERRPNTTQISLEGLGHMSQAISLYYPSISKQDPAANFSMQIYATQIFQAEFVRAQIEFYRRGSGLPQRTLGSLYWQLNEIWASPTWASLEVGGRWKPLHHIAGVAYSPIIIAPFRDDFNSLFVSVVSDLWQDVSGYASVTWYEWSGTQLEAGPIWSFENKSVNVGAINSTQIWNASLWELPGPLHTALAVLRTTVSTSDGGHYEAERFYVPQALSDVESIAAFVDPKLEVVYDAECGSFIVISHAVAAFVWLDQPRAARGYFDKNGFWMLPGNQTVQFVPFGKSSNFPQGWQNNVTVTSIYDLTVT